jgi:hypothetical protein
MTMLLPFDEKQFPSLANTKIKSIRSCVLYFVTTGRNAWHSTWVSYYGTQLHLSIDSAKQYAEKARVQGTVFTIKQQPSICLETDDGTLFVTQLWNDVPLSGYSKNALTPTPHGGQKLIEGFQDNYLIPGSLTQGAILSFHPSSRFWRKPPPLNSILIVATEISNLEIDPIQRGKLKAWSSYSYGSEYLLAWRERMNDINPKWVRALVR